jgi:glucosamine--fructose-6-phosphate aminotransferase (isomerizing)
LHRFLEGVTHVFLVGRGRSLAAAGEGGLLLKESAHFAAEGIGCAAFRHGPLDMAGPGVLVCVFAGDPDTAPLNRGLVADVVRGGGRVAWIGEDAELDAFRIPDSSPEGRSILEILPIQMISLALAARSGHAPGVFARLTKVTTVE